MLAGMMSALLACGLSACDAAACAVWLHGAAADRAARQKGEYRQQKAYTGIQKLQQSYVVDQINQELAAALTKLQETEEQVKTAKENKELAEENLDLITFSYNEGKANMVDVLSAQLSWTQAHTSLINAYLAEKMAVAEYRKVISE